MKPSGSGVWRGESNVQFLRDKRGEMICPFCGAEVSSGVENCPLCGASVVQTVSSQSLLVLPVGTRLGRYTIGKPLGQGGFAITYLGSDTLLSRPVAVKELFPEGCTRDGVTVRPSQISPGDFDQMRQKFLEEARLLARLSHPGIVKVYDFFKENNTAYMVMEYLEGKPLSKVWRRGEGG